MSVHATEAWRLAAVEVLSLSCSGCRCQQCKAGGYCEAHDRPSKHTTCARALRLARKFHRRALGLPEPVHVHTNNAKET